MLLRRQEEKEGKCPLDAEKKKADQFIQSIFYIVRLGFRGLKMDTKLQSVDNKYREFYPEVWLGQEKRQS